MLAAHLLEIAPFAPDDPGTWLDVVNGRSSILFATLAGVSLALVTGGPRRISGQALTLARGRILVRAGGIWVIGLLLIALAVPVFVILPAYALLFVLALPFLQLRARTLFILAIVLGVVMPFVTMVVTALPFWVEPGGALVQVMIAWHYPFILWIVFVLAGMAVGRANLRSLRTQVLVCVGGVAAAVVGYGLAWLDLGGGAGAGGWDAVLTADPHSGGVYEVFGSGGFAVAVIGACLLVCRTVLSWVILPLRAVGSMPLSAYSAQLVLWALWSLVAFGDVRDITVLDAFWPITIGTIVGCTLWSLLVGRGPLEFLLDRAARYLVRPIARLER